MKVTLISKTQAVNFEGSDEGLLIYIARVSSDKTEEEKLDKPEKLIKYLIDSKHWSPFDMIDFTVEVITSRAISAQAMRHRSFCFQEFSQRYSSNIEFEPIELREQHENNRQGSIDKEFNPIMTPISTIKGKTRYGNGQEKAAEIVAAYLKHGNFLYSDLIEAGAAKECARMILPMCTQTTFYMKGSLRSWIHYIEIREEEHSQKEHRLIAKEIKKIFIALYPITAKALGWIKEEILGNQQELFS